MAEVTVVLDCYEENVPKVCVCGGPMLRAGTICVCPECANTGVRLMYDAEWVHVDDRHVWQMVIGMSGSLSWLGPYWNIEAIATAARG